MYMFHNPHFCETHSRKLQSKMLISPNLFLFLETLSKPVIRILTQNDVNFKCLLFHRKMATAENTDQAAHVH